MRAKIPSRLPVIRQPNQSWTGVGDHGRGETRDEDLIRWYKAIPGKPPVCLVHGDLDAMQALQFRLTREVGASATIPEPGESVSL